MIASAHDIWWQLVAARDRDSGLFERVFPPGYPDRPNTGIIGQLRRSREDTSMAPAQTSTAPVGRFALTVSGGCVP